MCTLHLGKEKTMRIKSWLVVAVLIMLVNVAWADQPLRLAFAKSTGHGDEANVYLYHSLGKHQKLKVQPGSISDLCWLSYDQLAIVMNGDLWVYRFNLLDHLTKLTHQGNVWRVAAHLNSNFLFYATTPQEDGFYYLNRLDTELQTYQFYGSTMPLGEGLAAGPDHLYYTYYGDHNCPEVRKMRYDGTYDTKVFGLPFKGRDGELSADRPMALAVDRKETKLLFGFSLWTPNLLVFKLIRLDNESDKTVWSKGIGYWIDDCCFLPDNQAAITVLDDQSGNFNLFQMDLATKQFKKLANNAYKPAAVWKDSRL